jgi:CheY-like chemotaxis protein
MKTVLIMEDEKEIAEVLELMLSTKYKVFVTYRGEEALDVLGQEQVDLLLTDINVYRGMGGIELIEKSPAELPIVVLSGCLQNEFNIPKRVKKYLQKPASIESILGAVEEFIQ